MSGQKSTLQSDNIKRDPIKLKLAAILKQIAQFLLVESKYCTSIINYMKVNSAQKTQDRGYVDTIRYFKYLILIL